MLEKRIEQRLVDQVKSAGGLCMKWVAPAMAGVPDRICFFKGGKVVFVELKAPGKVPTPLQQRIHMMLSDLGAEVRVIDSLDDVDSLVAQFR